MSHCTLTIELVNGKDYYGPGDEVELIVRVEARKAFNCNRLSAQLGFETHGRGNRDSKWFSALTLHAGTIDEGVTEYPCVLIVPPISSRTPASYVGHYITLDWFVRARADVSWAFDPTEQMLIEIDAIGQPPPFEPPAQPPVRSVKLRGLNPGFFILAALFAAAAAYFFTNGKGPLIPALLLVPAAFIVTTLLRDRSAVKRLGRVGFGLWPKAPSPGSHVRAYVALEPPRSIDLEAVRVLIRAEEKATSGSGTNETTHTHELESVREVLLERASLEGMELWEAEADFEIPGGAPMSFSTGDNKVVWQLGLEVVPRGSKPLRTWRPLTIRSTQADDSEIPRG